MGGMDNRFICIRTRWQTDPEEPKALSSTIPQKTLKSYALSQVKQNTRIQLS